MDDTSAAEVQAERYGPVDQIAAEVRRRTPPPPKRREPPDAPRARLAALDAALHPGVRRLAGDGRPGSVISTRLHRSHVRTLLGKLRRGRGLMVSVRDIELRLGYPLVEADPAELRGVIATLDAVRDRMAGDSMTSMTAPRVVGLDLTSTSTGIADADGQLHRSPGESDG